MKISGEQAGVLWWLEMGKVHVTNYVWHGVTCHWLQ